MDEIIENIEGVKWNEWRFSKQVHLQRMNYREYDKLDLREAAECLEIAWLIEEWALRQEGDSPSEPIRHGSCLPAERSRPTENEYFTVNHWRA